MSNSIRGRFIRILALTSVLSILILFIAFPAPVANVFNASIPVGLANSIDTPGQVSLAMTTEPTDSICIDWTTIDTTLEDPVVLMWESGEHENDAVEFDAQLETKKVTDSTIPGVTQKNFYSATIDYLKANTQYYYRVGQKGAMSEVRSFKTAPDTDSGYTFIYYADPQVFGIHSRGWQANLDAAEGLYPDASFIYVAGDFTNDAHNEGQWESFFNQAGNAQFNAKFKGDLISKLPVVATMGNHDAADGVGLCSHFSWESEVKDVPVSYAFDYGAARMIILNFNEPYLTQNTNLRQAQYDFLKSQVTQAKKKNQWVIVGFHEALYSGGSHMSQTEAIEDRQFWAVKFADLDVDIVLQGHDHVFSRGFVNKNGYKVDITKQIGDRSYIAVDPANAPLYYDENCSSTLKFYGPLKNSSWIKPGDPIAPDFGYLDIDSALPAGYKNTSGKILNPGPCTNDDLDGTPGYYRAPTFTAITVTNAAIEFNTFMTGFDPNTNSIVRDTFLYDSLKVMKQNLEQ